MFQVTLLVTMCIMFSCIQPNHVYGANTVRSVNKHQVPTKKEIPKLMSNISFLTGIAVDSKGYIYIGYPKGISKLSPDGRVMKTWKRIGEKDLECPIGVTTDADDNVYLVDISFVAPDNLYARLVKMSAKGEFLLQFTLDCGHENYTSPQGVVVDSQGCIYVSGGPKSSMQKYSPSGELLSRWYTAGDPNHAFPMYLAVDSQGCTYVTDWFQRCVHKYGTDGSFIRDFAKSMNKMNTRTDPVGICIDGHDNIYVTGAFYNTVYKYNTAGTLLAKWPIASSYILGAVAIDKQNNLYVTDCNYYIAKIFKLNTKGKVLKCWKLEYL